MNQRNEVVLAVLPGQSDTDRIVIALRSTVSETSPAEHACKLFGDEEPTRTTTKLSGCPTASLCERSAMRPIVMRQETFCEAVGWFMQSCVELTTDQWAAMKAAIAIPVAPPSRAAVRPQRKHALLEPVVLSFETAHAASA